MAAPRLWQALRPSVRTGLAAAAGLLIPVLCFFAFRLFKIDQTSMAPTFLNGDVIVVNRLAYLLHSPRPGDVIAFGQARFNTERIFVKRVIALAGDKVELTGGELRVNGRLQSARHLKDATTFGLEGCGLHAGSFFEESLDPGGRHFLVHTADPATEREGTWDVPPGEVFVLGDNRNMAVDSRTLPGDPPSGVHVLRSDILGRVDAVAFSRDPCEKGALRRRRTLSGPNQTGIP